MSQIEQAEQQRRKILIHYTVSFLIWGGAIVLLALRRGQWSNSTSIVLTVVQLGAMLYWAVQLFRLLRFQKAMRSDPRIEEAINDEYTQAIRQRAFNLGFWVVITTQALFIILITIGIELQPMFAPMTTIVIGVVSVLGAALYFEQV